MMGREFQTCCRQGPGSAGRDEQTLQQRHHPRTLTGPAKPDAQGTRCKPAPQERIN